MDATGGDLLYVINNIGFGTGGKSILETTSEDILAITNEDFLPSHRASREFIKLLGDTEGATVTIVNGGLGHGLFPGWSKYCGRSFKNGILINSVSCFNAAIVDDSLKVSVCGACVWFSVSRKGETKNQFGLSSDIESGFKLAKAFATMAIGKKAGQNVDMKTVEEAEEVGKEYEQAR